MRVPRTARSATPERGFRVSAKMKPKFSCQVTLRVGSSDAGEAPLRLCKASLLFSPLPQSFPRRPSERAAELGLRLSHSGRRGRLPKSVAAAAPSVACVAGGAIPAHTCCRGWRRRQRRRCTRFSRRRCSSWLAAQRARTAQCSVRRVFAAGRLYLGTMAEQRRRCEWRCGDSVQTRVGCAIGMLCVCDTLNPLGVCMRCVVT